MKQNSQNPCLYPKKFNTRRELSIFLLTILEYRLNEYTKSKPEQPPIFFLNFMF